MEKRGRRNRVRLDNGEDRKSGEGKKKETGKRGEGVKGETEGERGEKEGR